MVRGQNGITGQGQMRLGGDQGVPRPGQRLAVPSPGERRLQVHERDLITEDPLRDAEAEGTEPAPVTADTGIPGPAESRKSLLVETRRTFLPRQNGEFPVRPSSQESTRSAAAR